MAAGSGGLSKAGLSAAEQSGVGLKGSLYAPLAVPPAVSKRQVARAWPSVEAATKALKAKRTEQALSLYRKAYTIDPRNIYAASGVADSLFILGRYAEAETAYRRAIVLQPDELRLKRSLGEIAIIRGNLRGANAIWRQVLATAPREFTANYRLAQIAVSGGRASQSLPFYRAALEAQPNNAKVWAQFGEALSYTERGSQARAALNRALGLNPNSIMARVALANLLSWNGDYSNAIVQYKQVLAREAANKPAHIGLADALTYARRPEEAIPQYQSILASDPGSSQARFGLGRALVFASRFDEAISPLRLAVRQQPQNTEALRLLALAQAGRDGSPSANASAALVTYRALLARQTRPEEQAVTLAAIGDLENGQNNIPGARRAYENSLRLAPGNIEASNSLAQILISQGETDQARNVVESALARDPGNVRARILQIVIENRSGNHERALALSRPLEGIPTPNPGDALQLAGALREAGNPDAANRIIARLAANLPANPAQALEVANAVRDSGAFNDSLPLYRRLIQSNPNNLAARLEIAEALTWLSRPAEARAELEYVLNREPQNVEALTRRATVLVREQTPESLALAQLELAKILARDPQNARARIASAELQTVQQKFPAAVVDYRAVLEADPNNLRARLGLARNLYYSRQIEPSIAEYQELLRRAPESNQVKLELGQVYLDLNRLSDAEALFNQVSAERRALLPPLLDGQPILRANGQLSASLLPFRATRSSALQVLGGQILGATRVIGRAIPVAGKPRRYSVERVLLAQATAPDTTQAGGSTPGAGGQASASDVGSASTGSATSGAGNEAAGAGVAASAGGAAGAGVNNAPISVPQTPGAASNSAASASASSAQSSDVATQPQGEAEQVAALRGLGEVRRRQNRLDEAIDFFNRALALDANDERSRIGLAQSLRGKSNYAGALTEVQRVLSVDAGNLPARALRAQLFSLLGRKEEAQTELDAIVSTLDDPDNPARAEDFQVIAGAFVGLQNYETALQVLALGRQKFPDEIILRRANAETLLFARRFPQARAAYEELLVANPRDTDALLGRARVFNYSDALAEAEPAYRALLEAQPENYQGTVELADVLSRRGSYEESARLYRTAIERNANDLQPRLELGRVLRYQREFDQSETVLSDILAIDARYAPALTERGILRGQRGDYEKGLADLDAALEIAPNDLNTVFGLAEVQSYAGQYDKSIRNYRAGLAKDPSNTKGRTELGLVLSYAGRHDEALRELNTVLEQAPQNVSAQIAKASVLARARRLDESVALYNTILQADPRNVRAREGLAEALVLGRDYGQAVQIYDALIADSPGNQSYRLSRARALGYGKRYAEAAAALRAVVSADPQNREARLTLAEVLTNSEVASSRREAIVIYRSILRDEPANVPARVGLGRVLSYTGQYKEAETVLSSVVREAPQNSEALLALAENQRFAGRFFDAGSTYRGVLKLDPANATATEGLRLAGLQTRSSATLAVRSYSDTNGVRVRGIIFGPTFNTRAGQFGVTIEQGRFRDDNVSLKRQALNLLVARQIGPLSARLVLTRLKYGGNAPDKNLYDLSLGRTQGPRFRYFLGASRLDIFESAGAVLRGITADQQRAGVDFPLARKLDLELRYAHYNYSDSNNRNTLGASLFYRLKPGTPSLRVGLGYVRDNTDFFSPLYYTPQDYNAVSVLADYVVDRGPLRYGLFAQHPLTNATGNNGRNRPADTLFGYGSYDLSDLVQVFVNGGIVRSPNFNSNDVTAGVTARF